MQQQYSILWADDEIELLKPHILFLTKKGYDITPVNSGADAIEKFQEQNFDLVFLDENMPGMTGLETLAQLKTFNPHIPVVMITKSEEEHIMEEAIGARIADYLIKPLNPNQILLSVKKILESKTIITETTNRNYQQDFRNISMAFGDNMNYAEWAEMYKKLVYWELEIEQTQNRSMHEVLQTQKHEGNINFAKFINENYEKWLNSEIDSPVLSHDLMYEWVFPLLKESTEPLFFILIDNLRLDQWHTLAPIISEYFTIENETSYYSILPTTTAYARNSIFAGMTPLEMSQFNPDLWEGDDDEEIKNNHEKEFLRRQLDQNDFKQTRMSYNKIIHAAQGKQLVDNFSNLLNNHLNAIVYNFVDMLSHARTDTNMIRELAPDEAAYRSLTRSWFLHSPLLDMLKKISEKKCRLVITTDHGTIRTREAYKIIGDKNTNTNLRYKQGKNLAYDRKNVVIASKPERFFLPKVNVSSTYVFATEDYFFAYPNNYNHYAKYYRDTFQHGGVSMEEMIVPFVVLSPK